METLTQKQTSEVKSRSFLLNRGTALFSGRILTAGAVYTADDFEAIAKIARETGSGRIVLTNRMSIELVGIPFEKIPIVEEMAAASGLYVGGTGAKLRPIVACKGTTCVYGNYDTQELAQELFHRYYLGWGDVKLPHKFKIGVGGCPNNCMKVNLNDFGVEGHRAPRYDAAACRGCATCQVEARCPSHAASLSGGKMQIDGQRCLTCGVCIGKCPFKAVSPTADTQYLITFGGTWGRKCRVGTPFPRAVTREEIFPLLEKALLWFIENAQKKERLGQTIDRLGITPFLAEMECDHLLKRRAAILG